jgi:hypothetical protein
MNLAAAALMLLDVLLDDFSPPTAGKKHSISHVASVSPANLVTRIVRTGIECSIVDI